MSEVPDFKDGAEALEWMEARLSKSWVDEVNPAPKAPKHPTAADLTIVSGAPAPTAISTADLFSLGELSVEEFNKMMGF